MNGQCFNVAGAASNTTSWNNAGFANVGKFRLSSERNKPLVSNVVDNTIAVIGTRGKVSVT